MADVFTWSRTAADNDDADGDINWAEGQLPGTVNNSARAMMAAVANWRDDTGGQLTLAGAANTYTLTTNSVLASYADGQRIHVVCNASNTGASTLNVDSVGAKSIRKIESAGEGALVSGDMIAAGHYILQYDASANAAAGAWILLNPTNPTSSTFDTALAVTVAGNCATFTNSTDSTPSQVAIFAGDRATETDNDFGYISLQLANDADEQIDFARIAWAGGDVSDGTEDGTLYLSTMNAGTIANNAGGVRLNGTSFSPSSSGGSRTLGEAASTRWGGLALEDLSFIDWNNTAGQIIYQNSGPQFQMLIALAAELTLSNVSLFVPNVFNDTVASGTDIVVASNGRIRAVSSSLRFKKDVEPMEHERARRLIMESEPIWYRPTDSKDQADRSFYGLAAEQVAKIDPRFVSWEDEWERDKNGNVVKDEDGEPIMTKSAVRPHGIMYSRFVVPLISVAQEHDERISAIESRLDKLEKAA